MSSDYESDGLDNFSLDQIGMQAGAFGGARLLTFKEGQFFTRDGEEIGPGRELMVLGLKKIVQKFVGGKLVDTKILPDGEPAPDLKTMNEAAPKEEWGTDLAGNPAGPYVLVLALKMLDENTMDRFAFVTRSKGGSIAIGDLSDKVKLIRHIRKDSNVVPIVSCRWRNFPIKRLNIVKKRPDFAVLRFTKLGGDDGGLPAPEAPKPLNPPTTSTPPASPTSSSAPSTPSSAPSTPQTSPREAATLVPTSSLPPISTPVAPTTLAEETADAVPF